MLPHDSKMSTAPAKQPCGNASLVTPGGRIPSHAWVGWWTLGQRHLVHTESIKQTASKGRCVVTAYKVKCLCGTWLLTYHSWLTTPGQPRRNVVRFLWVWWSAEARLKPYLSLICRKYVTISISSLHTSVASVLLIVP